jgi:hypothetical protein
MTENQSRNYINKRFGRIISRRTYYNYKTKAYEGNEIVRLGPKWLRGMGLGSVLHNMENTPLIVEKRLA